MTNESRITFDELGYIFNNEIPVEVYQILFNGPDDMTVAEAREQVVAYAKSLQDHKSEIRDLAELILEIDFNHDSFGGNRGQASKVWAAELIKAGYRKNT